MTDVTPAAPTAATPPARTARRTPLVVRALFVVAMVCTLVGFVEALFMGYDWMTGGLSFLRAPDRELGVRSWTVHHAMRPGYDIPPTKTNSFGLRSPEVAVPKPDGVHRILLLGDSFTFGFLARDEEVFARRLEQRLRRRPGFESVEVVNAGVLSYCPLLEYLQYRHALHVLEPDLVVLNFDMSDVQDHLAYSRDLAVGADGAPLFVTEPSLLQVPGLFPDLISVRWLRQKIQTAEQRLAAAREDVPFIRDEDRYIWALDNGPEMADEARAAMEPIAHLQRLLAHHGIPLVLATYPQPWQVAGDATAAGPIRGQYAIGQGTVHLNDRAFRRLEAFAAERGLPFVNATPAFRAADRPAALFLDHDFHFSPRGNDLYAQVLEEYLASRGR